MLQLTLSSAAELNLDGIIETFSTWGKPQEIRKLLFAIYSELTQYVLNDADRLGADLQISEAMYFLKTIIENCDEMENLKDRQIKLFGI